jgi:hypothetical protein
MIGPIREEAGSLGYKERLVKRCLTKILVGGAFVAPILPLKGHFSLGWLVLVLMVAAAFFSVWAASDYAESKGLRRSLGLLGLFSVFGLIPLALWPDRYVYNKEAQKLRRKAGRR